MAPQSPDLVWRQTIEGADTVLSRDCALTSDVNDENQMQETCLLKIVSSGMRCPCKLVDVRCSFEGTLINGDNTFIRNVDETYQTT